MYTHKSSHLEKKFKFLLGSKDVNLMLLEGMSIHREKTELSGER